MTPPVDHLYVNGRIHTMASSGPSIVQAIAVRDGRMAATGSTDDVMGLRSKTTGVTDLDGGTVLPGFIETHMHPVTSGIQEQQVVIPDDIGSIEALIAFLRDHATGVPPGTEILAWRFDHAAVSEKRHLTASDLDRATTAHPLIVRNASGHLAYTNTLVLREHGIDATTPDPPGGEIVHDAVGNPTGQLNELTAMDLVTGILPNLDPAGNRRALAITQQVLLAAGVTSVHDMGVWSPEYFAAYAETVAAGDLTVRARLYVFTPDLDDSPVPANLSGELLGFGGIKFAVDGMLLGETAHVRHPYEGVGGTGVLLQTAAGTRRGRDRCPPQGLAGGHPCRRRRRARHCSRCDRKRADHGSRGTIIGTGWSHVEVIQPDQIERMHRLGVTASMLLNGIHRWGDHLLDVLGPERAAVVSPLRSLIAAGIPTALHSDCPITPVSPLASIATAVTRTTGSGASVAPDEAVTVGQAIGAVTSQAARLGFEENDKGTLEAGKLADFMVLADDPFGIDPAGIAEIEVLKTVVGGDVVWGD